MSNEQEGRGIPEEPRHTIEKPRIVPAPNLMYLDESLFLIDDELSLPPSETKTILAKIVGRRQGTFETGWIEDMGESPHPEGDGPQTHCSSNPKLT